jgi:hypothetical protein
MANKLVWTSRRYLSCSHWGLIDVTDYPWCCAIDYTEVIYGYGPEGEYDGTE